ncbi:uncharacterized protein E0L32_007665 [Thyridium curvatum]|uniref:Major facilitator superfamily (MFS) profile domain-containing protein n=1 Tax=Thyridium curvatum TaxID=1093900 RepID=A0A507AY50_9PEZI|nr:uncharacterized protein E0L32_007665 [Thyridium curvatum]TPX11686.1 hypothetical protein E0L32_007665 [Thyridium curvatum]
MAEVPNKSTAEPAHVEDGDRDEVHAAEKQLHDAEETGKLDAINQAMAMQGTLAEHELSNWQALVKYRKAVFWSVFVSLSIIMRAYDIEITGNFFALPAFRNHFGEMVPGHSMQIPTQWQVAMSMGAIVGQVLGAWAVAVPMDRFGRKKTLIGYLLVTVALVFMQVFAPSRQVLTASMYLCGIIWGGYHVLAPTYASEVLPLRLRGYFTGYVNLCYVIGQFLQTGITRGFVHWDSVWAYKIPYAIQWVWPAILLLGLWWAPESPWWLIRQNRMEDAKAALDALSNKSNHAENHNILAMMVKTDLYEREVEVGATYRDVFKGPNLRRLEISAMLFVCQNFSGNPVGFATYLFEQVGLSTENAFNMGIGLNGVGFIGCIFSVFPIAYFGRRKTWMMGITYCLVVLWIVGFMCLAKDYKTNPAYSWAQATLLITLQLIYSLSLGPLCFTISSEIPSTKLRAKTLGIAATINGATYLVITVAGPYLLNPGSANAGAKIEFLWGGLTLLNTIWSYFRLPETDNRTYEELDILFDRRVPARQFKKYVIEQEEE